MDSFVYSDGQHIFFPMKDALSFFTAMPFYMKEWRW